MKKIKIEKSNFVNYKALPLMIKGILGRWIIKDKFIRGNTREYLIHTMLIRIL